MQLLINWQIVQKAKVEKQKDLYIQNGAYSMAEALTTAGLFELYFEEYKIFQNIFGMNISKFRDIATHLIRARNPYQHNNDDLINHTFKDLTRSYCELLNNRIDGFEEKNKIII